jgi:hypothetical protein
MQSPCASVKVIDLPVAVQQGDRAALASERASHPVRVLAKSFFLIWQLLEEAVVGGYKFLAIVIRDYLEIADNPAAILVFPVIG